ncbi:hypothetical protein D3C72_128830 [compost metagenome]
MGTKNTLLIGFEPNNPDLANPQADAADRARIYPVVEELKRRGVNVEIVAPETRVTLRVSARRSRLWEPRREKKEEFWIFDVSDSILTPPNLGLLRNFWFEVKVRPQLVRYLRTCDLVVAGSEVQSAHFSSYVRSCTIPDVAIYLDQADSSLQAKVTAQPKSLTFGWDGQGLNFPFLEQLVRDNIGFFRREDVKLLVVTDRRDSLRGVDNEALLRSLRVNSEFRVWDRHTYMRDIGEALVGLAPLDLACPFASAKPENKVIAYMSQGMSVVCAATQAYSNVALRNPAVRDCKTAADWRESLEYFYQNRDDIVELGMQAHHFARQHYSAERVADRWIDVFRSFNLNV